MLSNDLDHILECLVYFFLSPIETHQTNICWRTYSDEAYSSFIVSSDLRWCRLEKTTKCNNDQFGMRISRFLANIYIQYICSRATGRKCFALSLVWMSMKEIIRIVGHPNWPIPEKLESRHIFSFCFNQNKCFIRMPLELFFQIHVFYLLTKQYDSITMSICRHLNYSQSNQKYDC